MVPFWGTTHFSQQHRDWDHWGVTGLLTHGHVPFAPKGSPRIGKARSWAMRVPAAGAAQAHVWHERGGGCGWGGGAVGQLGGYVGTSAKNPQKSKGLFNLSQLPKAVEPLVSPCPCLAKVPKGDPFAVLLAADVRGDTCCLFHHGAWGFTT